MELINVTMQNDHKDRVSVVGDEFTNSVHSNTPCNPDIVPCSPDICGPYKTP